MADDPTKPVKPVSARARMRLTGEIVVRRTDGTEEVHKTEPVYIDQKVPVLPAEIKDDD